MCVFYVLTCENYYIAFLVFFFVNTVSEMSLHLTGLTDIFAQMGRGLMEIIAYFESNNIKTSLRKFLYSGFI